MQYAEIFFSDEKVENFIGLEKISTVTIDFAIAINRQKHMICWLAYNMMKQLLFLILVFEFKLFQKHIQGPDVQLI